MADWIKGAIKRPGEFRAKARGAGMGVAEYARHVLAEGSRADARTRRQARLAQTLSRLRNRIEGVAGDGWRVTSEGTHPGLRPPLQGGDLMGSSGVEFWHSDEGMKGK